MTNVPTSSLEFYGGDRKRLRFAIVDDDGNAMNLSGSPVLKWTMFPAEKSTVALSKTVGSGLTIESEAGGIVVVDISTNDTKTLLGYYDHELVYVDDDGNRSTLHKGQIKFLKAKTPII